VSYKLKIKNWIYVLLAVMLSGVEASFSQNQPIPIKKSDKIEMVDGKKFYIHSVEKGQTLYSISKTYGTTVDIVLANNPDAIDGLKPNDILKIPFIASAENVKKEIAKTETTVVVKEKYIPFDSVKIQKAIIDPKLLSAEAASFFADSFSTDNNNKVALFLPFSLDKIDSMDVDKISNNHEKLPDDIKTGLEFYEGAKMAFDSLRKQGFKGKMFVYDSNVDSAGMVKLLKKPELKEMNLLIGLLPVKKFDPLLKYAKANNINIVAPSLLNNNILLGNTNASKVTPSYGTQVSEIAKYVAEKHAGQNILLFNSANPKDKPYLNIFKSTANPELVKSKSDTVKEVTFSTLNNFFSQSKPNIIVIPSANPLFVSEAINQLYRRKQEKKDSIIIFGISNWQDIETLDFEYLNTLHAHISSFTFVDYKNEKTKRFIKKYRDEFRTEPTSHVFSGFDITYYYIGLLQKYGNRLNKSLPSQKQKGIQHEFNFYQMDFASGYENRGVGIMKFENYSYTRVK